MNSMLQRLSPRFCVRDASHAASSSGIVALELRLAEVERLGQAALGYAARSMQLTGDAATEFVVTDDCDTAGVRTDTSRVFPGVCAP